MKEVLFGIITIVIISLIAVLLQQQVTSEAIYAGVCSQESVSGCKSKAVRSPCALNGELGECIPLYRPYSCMCMSNP